LIHCLIHLVPLLFSLALLCVVPVPHLVHLSNSLVVPPILHPLSLFCILSGPFSLLGPVSSHPFGSLECPPLQI
jgi:hypothetical protein